MSGAPGSLPRMDVLLIPGFWLDASAWDPVVPAIRAAGHEPRPLTPLGVDPADAGVGLRDQVEEVLRLVDATEGPVALVGHSGGAAVVHAVVDARPDRVARAIYVDALPLGDGSIINDEFEAEDGLVALPPREAFEDADLVDMDDATWAAFAARARLVPERVAIEPQSLRDERRYDVPVTVIASEFSAADIDGLIGRGHPFTAEFSRIRDRRVVDLPTGHWPMLTRPDDLARALAEALA